MRRRFVTAILAGALCLGAGTPVSALYDAYRGQSDGSGSTEGQRVRRISSNPAHRCPQFEPMFRAYGLPVQAFSFLAWRESKCVLKAVGWNYHKGMGREDCGSGRYEKHRRCEAVKSHDLGLLQINSTWVSVTRRLCGGSKERFDMTVLFDLGCNLRVSKYLYDNGGLAHWAITG